MSFFGEYRHTIDAKGRLIVPSRIRDALGGDTAVLVRYMDNCIAVFSQEGFETFRGQLLAQPKSNEDARKLIRTLGAGTHVDLIDKQGRINVPQKLRDHAGIDKEVVVVGAIDHAEIWEPQQWAANELDQDGLNERAGGLSF
ncbi:MAG TPA: division/cell wall cluster transcriptional repressor MraZ [Actinomycetota bacterium]|nr:division/cell wall cluster transcriptional repressor MraZ [Actinomycetota bacterium]